MSCPPPNPLHQSQLYPSDTIIGLDDPYCCKTGYIQLHDLCFTLVTPNYSTSQVRKHYNIPKQLKRYFTKRYFFFSLFDEGIELDDQSWYSVVAEPISMYLVQRLKMVGVESVFQPFCGVGGISVQFAGHFQKLIVNDICQNKIKMLKNNLRVYAKGLNTLTIHNRDFLLIPPYPVDCAVVCPPWGGVDVSEYSHKDLDEIMKPKLSDILLHCKKFSRNIILQMPKTTNLQNLLKIVNLCFLCPVVKIQKIHVDGRLSQLFVYIGEVGFTGFNSHVYRHILNDTGKDIKNLKQSKKDLKKKIKQEQFDIFAQIYHNLNVNSHKHLFFDQDVQQPGVKTKTKGSARGKMEEEQYEQ